MVGGRCGEGAPSQIWSSLSVEAAEEGLASGAGPEDTAEWQGLESASHTDCLGRWGWWNPGLCAALPSLALRVPNKALTSRAQAL